MGRESRKSECWRVALYFQPALFPGLSHFQFLLTCSVQKLEGEELGVYCMLIYHITMHSHVMKTNHAFCTSLKTGQAPMVEFKLENIAPKVCQVIHNI